MWRQKLIYVLSFFLFVDSAYISFFDTSIYFIQRSCHINYLHDWIFLKNICKWSFFILQMLADSIDFCDIKIDRLDIIVEVDEKKLYKIKCSKGHRVGRCMGCCRSWKNRKIVSLTFKKRDVETLELFLKCLFFLVLYVHRCGDLCFFLPHIISWA